MLKYIPLLLIMLAVPVHAEGEKPIWQQEVEALEDADKAEAKTEAAPKTNSYSTSEEPEDKTKLDDPNQIYYTPEEIKQQAPHNQSDPATVVAPSENLIDLPPVQAEVPKWVESNKGSVKVLNKVYNRNSKLDLTKGQEVKLGNLRLKLEKCFSVPESDKKDSSALLLISEVFTSQPNKEIFHGWMFSSSPAISALEHPLYDVILLGCEEPPQEVKADSETKEKDAKKDPKADKKADKKENKDAKTTEKQPEPAPKKAAD